MKAPEQSLWSGRLLHKTLALAALFFCCSFNYTLLAATKDAIIITAPGSGVEVVPFLMSYGVLPCSIAFMFVYSRMSDVRRRPPQTVDPSTHRFVGRPAPSSRWQRAVVSM